MRVVKPLSILLDTSGVKNEAGEWHDGSFSTWVQTGGSLRHAGGGNQRNGGPVEDPQNSRRCLAGTAVLWFRRALLRPPSPAWAPQSGRLPKDDKFGLVPHSPNPRSQLPSRPTPRNHASERLCRGGCAKPSRTGSRCGRWKGWWRESCPSSTRPWPEELSHPEAYLGSSVTADATLTTRSTAAAEFEVRKTTRARNGARESMAT